MRKILFFLVMVSVMGLVGITQAIADTGLNAVILSSSIINVSITPQSIDFGPLSPCTTNNPALNGPIILNASDHNNNADITITVTDVTGEPFHSGLKLDESSAIGTIVNMPCIGTEICTYDIKTLVPTLDVACGTKAGAKSGAIVYTVTVA